MNGLICQHRDAASIDRNETGSMVAYPEHFPQDVIRRILRHIGAAQGNGLGLYVTANRNIGFGRGRL